MKKQVLSTAASLWQEGRVRCKACAHLSRWKAAISALCRSKSEK